ncbi:NAD(P)H-dependent oxidoreductase [Luteimonas saliphila]|uniref:NAD(P)H-dependent oxidoreductase n=1 Tax=Luteimonas saliphila TaxID=2804919 RepID=UPI00192D84E5
MNVLSLLAHPRPTSFCHAVSERARTALAAQGHELTHHDLYADGFEPRLAVRGARVPPGKRNRARRPAGRHANRSVGADSVGLGQRNPALAGHRV